MHSGGPGLRAHADRTEKARLCAEEQGRLPAAASRTRIRPSLKMASGGLRNYIKRIEKKERPTPLDRVKYGQIERKKDYKVRAEASHAKERLLKKLETDALLKNPDEFYHGMENIRTRQGVRVKTVTADGLEDPNDRIPDVALVAAQKREARRLESLLMRYPSLAGRAAGRRHIVFVSSDEEEAGLADDERALGDTVPDAARDEYAEAQSRLQKIEKELARRFSRAAAKKQGDVYSSKREVGVDSYGNKVYALVPKRHR